MAQSEKIRTFLDKVDSIQTRFLESLVTGQRDAVFGKTGATCTAAGTQANSHPAYADSPPQEGTEAEDRIGETAAS